MVHERVAWVQVDGSPEFSFRPGPIPITQKLYLCQRRMSIAQAVVQFEGLPSGGPGERNGNFWLQARHSKNVCVGQAGVGNGVARILLNRLLKILTGKLHSIVRPVFKREAASKI